METTSGFVGATLRVARLKPSVRDLLARDGVLERLGDDRIHETVASAVDAASQS